MGDELRWAARYQFLEELWRERDRIVFDPQLEQALHADIEGSPSELLARLLPGDEPDARVWMTLANDRRAASFARQNSGTVFVGLDAAAELATDEAWQVALVSLPALGEGGREALGPELLALLDVLGEKAGEDPERSVVLALACEPSESEAAYERLADLVEELFGDARIYGLARPAMAAAYDFGRIFDDAEQADDEVAIEVDTTLGSDPSFGLYLAVVGDRVPAEGLTFVELPSEAPGEQGPRGGEPAGDDLGAMRAQLAESQRRGDLQAIERLSLLEKLEQAEERAASLGEALARARGGEAEPASGAAPEGGERLDAVLARERALRWENDRLRGELDNLRARPVESLEAELASLRARLAEAEDELEELDEELEEAAIEDAMAHETDETDETAGEPNVAFELVVENADSPARERERKRLRAALDKLLARLERGAELPALELHRELSALRKML